MKNMTRMSLFLKKNLMVSGGKIRFHFISADPGGPSYDKVKKKKKKKYEKEPSHMIQVHFFHQKTDRESHDFPIGECDPPSRLRSPGGNEAKKS